MGVKLSVIVPVYNVAAYLEQCLHSVLNQSLTELEVICINDASTDNSLQLLHHFQQRDARLKVLTIEKSGQGIARNKGIEMAQGQFIGFVDADDWVNEKMFETLYDAAMRHECDIACCVAHCYDSTTLKRISMPYFDQLQLRTQGKKEMVFDKEKIPDVLEQLTVAAWNKIYKISFIRANNIEFYKTPPHEDIYFSFHALTVANKLCVVPRALYHYRVNRIDSTMNDFAPQAYHHVIEVLSATAQLINRSADKAGVHKSFGLFKIKQLIQSLNKALLDDNLDTTTKKTFFSSVRKELEPLQHRGLMGADLLQYALIRSNLFRLYKSRIDLYRMKIVYGRNKLQ